MLGVVFGLFIVVFFGVSCFLITFVFCFWFVYLLDGTTRKWKIYINALRCLQRENFDYQQQIIVYNAKTEFVKNVFLFFMNFIEWLLLISTYIAQFINLAEDCPNRNTTYAVGNSSRHMAVLTCIFKNFGAISTPFIGSIFQLFTNNCAVLTTALVACLCMYLASRFSQCSWISSYNIPHIISLSILYLVVTQVMVSFCYLSIIGRGLNLLLLTASTLFTVQQYRKLLMVISWTIVDMRVSGNDLLLKRQVKMKRTFSRLFSFLFIGIFFILLSEYLQFSLLICWINFRSYSSSFVDISYCGNSYFPFPEIENILYIINFVFKMLGVIGIVFSYTPYVGYGICTMFVVLRRRFTGKSGYRTHYHNNSYAPFI